MSENVLKGVRWGGFQGASCGYCSRVCVCAFVWEKPLSLVESNTCWLRCFRSGLYRSFIFIGVVIFVYLKLISKFKHHNIDHRTLLEVIMLFNIGR